MSLVDKLSPEEINHVILEIVTSERYVTYKGEPVILVQPTGQQKLFSNFVEQTSLKEALKEGFLSEKDLTDAMRSEVFTVKDQEELNFVQSKIKTYEFLIKKRTNKQSTTYLEEIRLLRGYKDQENSLLNKKKMLENYTAEYKAKEDKYFNLLACCVLNINREPMWQSASTMLSAQGASELASIYGLLNDFLSFYWGYDVKIIRQIARSGQWRNIFVGAIRGTLEMFPRGSKDFSNDQSNLLSWSMFYQDIYEMSYKDRPSQETIEDDQKLDEYLEKFTKKFLAEQALDRKEDLRSKLDAKDHQDVIVTASSSNYVKFGKQDLYSDTGIIKGKAKEGSTTYSEKDRLMEIKLRNHKKDQNK